ncbi:MAG: ATP-dependent sacrificial sulfur transferase LarE [Victivallaceae bacterium]|nr:ATP-dependent sacrificial sulfur transferase LarE [Victivallaceae bacterium]
MDEQLGRLESFLAARCAGGVALAFSGGVDSSLLLSVLAGLRRETEFPLLIFNARSVFQPEHEMQSVARHADEYGVKVEYFNFMPLVHPEIRQNPPDRCYICKKRIFAEFRAFADSHGVETLADGTNADDLSTYRPGLRALHELGVVSPLAELGIGKAKIREIAALLGLKCASKPSTPCLATRFEYGTALTLDALMAVGRGEALIRRILPDTADLRLRVHGGIARIEVSPEFQGVLLEHRDEIVAGLAALGFRHVTLDLAGFRSGSMDAEVGNRSR